jgi:hypothetical protein
MMRLEYDLLSRPEICILISIGYAYIIALIVNNLIADLE